MRKPLATVKLYALLLVFLSLSPWLFAQSQGISYQAVARDGSGTLMQNQNMTVKFKVHIGSVNGSTVYEESHNVSTNDYGLFTLIIGSGSVISGNFSTLDWIQDEHFLEVFLDGQSLGSEEIQSVPYSKVATNMELSDLQDVSDDAPAMNDILTWEGGKWKASSFPSVDTNPNDDITNSTNAGGDLKGTYPNPVVKKLLGRSLDETAPNVNQVLKWNGSAWKPTDEIGSVWTNFGGNAEFSGDIFIGGGSQSHDNLSEIIGIEAQSDNWYLGANNSASASQTDFFIGLSTSSSNSHFYIENGGDVGIGTDNPTSKLTVAGTTRGTYNGSTRYSFSAGSGAATGTFRGPNTPNISFTHESGNSDRGFVYTRNENSAERASLFSGAGDQGVVRTYGPNNSLNAVISSASGSANRGSIRVFDTGGGQEAGMFVNSSGQGIVFGDQKNFRMEHPENPDKEIWYCSLEGPEAAAYARGTGRLVGGKVMISFPDHFRLVANPSTLTIILTPLSGQSKGLAVVEKTANGFSVEELWQGQGNYEFDWEVKGVRKGHENYRVIRDASEMEVSGVMDKPAKDEDPKEKE